MPSKQHYRTSGPWQKRDDSGSGSCGPVFIEVFPSKTGPQAPGPLLPRATGSGFTLVEVMVALAVMAIVVTIAFSGLTVGMNTWERGSRAIDEFDQRNTIERLLKRQLALASPAQFTTADQKFALFRGSNHRLEFISDYSLSAGASDFQKIDYAIEGGRFLYSERTMVDYVPMENEELPTEVLATFKEVSFRYLGRDADGNGVWLDEWMPGAGLPLAVLARIDDNHFVIRLVNR